MSLDPFSLGRDQGHENSLRDSGKTSVKSNSSSSDTQVRRTLEGRWYKIQGYWDLRKCVYRDSNEHLGHTRRMEVTGGSHLVSRLHVQTPDSPPVRGRGYRDSTEDPGHTRRMEMTGGSPPGVETTRVKSELSSGFRTSVLNLNSHSIRTIPL